MMVKVGSGYLELNELIEVEKKVKLFEDISATEGDFSYAFSIPKTQNNRELIGIYTINDTEKKWNKRVPASILSESGVPIHTGYIRVTDGDGDNKSYEASFFSGNTNWIESLNVRLSLLDWSDFDKEFINSFDQTNRIGIVRPLVDSGLMIDRQHPYFDPFEIVPFFLAKDIVTRVMTLNGFKVTGELLEDPIYNKVAVTQGTNNSVEDEKEKRTAYVGKSSGQVITSSFATVTFTNTSSPFYNSELLNWSVASSRYTFDMDVQTFKVDVKLIMNNEGYFYVRLLKNGTDEVVKKKFSNVKEIFYTFNVSDNTQAGDYYEVQAGIVAAIFPNRTIVAGSWVRVTPGNFWKVFASTVIPDMVASEFVSNMFRMLNMLASFKPETGTIKTIKLDNVFRTEPIDLSDALTIDQNNFSEVSSDYAKKNLMIWGEQSYEPVDQYNEANELPYGGGSINIDNDFLEEEGEFLEMDFVAPWQQNYGFIGMDMPYHDMLNITVLNTRDLTSVSDNAGQADFNYSGSAFDFEGIVRISESTDEEYNGTYYWVGSSGGFSSITNIDIPYTGNSTGKVEFLQVSLKSVEPIMVLFNGSQVMSEVSGVNRIWLGLAPRTDFATANFLPTENYKLSLSFEDIKRQYFTGVEKVLNTGIKCYASGYLSEKQYNDIDFTRTVRIDDSVFFIQVIRGYKGSKYPVELELIKIR